jgi:hypothetical protein
MRENGSDMLAIFLVNIVCSEYSSECYSVSSWYKDQLALDKIFRPKKECS